MEDARLEQGNLFDFWTQNPKNTKVANHPTSPQKSTEPRSTPGKQAESPNPYFLRHHSYSECLKWFNGNNSLALYWFNQQDKKDQ